MQKLKRILNSPVMSLGLTPLLFAASQLIILGIYWITKGYAGDLTITISRYVGLEIWSSILFAIFNAVIIVIMFRYYLHLKSSRSILWFIFGCLQVVGFSLLTIFPANAFMPTPAREIVIEIHEYSARLMFLSMLMMAIETFRISRKNHLNFLQKFKLTRTPKNVSFYRTTTPACIAFICLGIIFLTAFFMDLSIYWNFILIIETTYIYAFMAFLLLTQNKNH